MTNRGEGLVCGIIRNDDGAISQSLKEYRKTASPEVVKDLFQQLHRLRAEVVRRRVLVVDWYSPNFLVQKNGGSLQLKLIDFQTRPNTARFFKRLKAARMARRMMPSY